MLKLLLGDPNTRKLKRYQPIVEEINFLEEEISQLTDDELRRETHDLKLNSRKEWLSLIFYNYLKHESNISNKPFKRSYWVKVFWVRP